MHRPVLPALLIALAGFAAIDARPSDSSAPPGASPRRFTLEDYRFGRVKWGRNSVRLRYRNDQSRAVSLVVRIRTGYPDSGSPVVWDATYPALLPPGQEGEIAFEYFVRPDHGRMEVEFEAVDAAGTADRQVREFEFSAPVRGDYLLQTARHGADGLVWEGRVLPPFRVRESEHFIIYYFPGSDAEADMERIIPQREKIFQALTREFGVSLSGKAIFFFYPDQESARKITGHRADGWAYGNTIVEVYGARRKIDPHHELVHLVAARIGSPPVLLSEGLATSRESDFSNAGKYPADVEQWCRGLMKQNALIPLRELMVNTSLGEDITRPRISYPQTACFTRYLIERFGWERFRRAYAEMENSAAPAVLDQNLDRFERVFGASLSSVEADWRASLSAGRSRVPREVVRKVVVEETVPYLVARGRDFLMRSAPAEGEKVLREAVLLDPSDLGAHFWLAQAFHLKGDRPAALEEYAQVIRLGGRQHVTEVAWSLVWSGQILDDLGKREEALDHYRRAEGLQDTSAVQIEGKKTNSLEAAREGLAHPHLPNPGP